MADINEGTSEEEIKQYQARLLDSVSDAIISTDANFNIQSWNKAAEKIYGWKAEEVLGKNLNELLKAKLITVSREKGTERAEDGGGSEAEVIHYDRYGRELFMQARVVQLKNEKGEVTGGLGVLRNITENKKAEKQIDLERRRLEAILEAAPSAVALVEASDRTFSYVNKRAADLFGVDFLGLDLVDFLARIKPLKMDGTPYPLEEMAFSYSLESGQEIRNQEMITQKTNNLKIPTEVSSSPLYDDKGQITAAVITFEDITDRKRREANQTFLAEITQDLARLASVAEIMGTIGHKMGHYFNVNNCLIADIDETRESVAIKYFWHTPIIPDVEGMHKYSEYLPLELLQGAHRGEIIVVKNTGVDLPVHAEEYASFNISAFIAVPILRKNEWRYLFAISASAPRDWREDEIELVREIANRLFSRLERARAEEALLESEAKARALVKYAPTGIYEIDYRGPRFLSVNDAMCSLSGYTHDELMAANPMDLLDQDSREKFTARMKAQLAGQAIDDVVDFTVRKKDGSLISVTLNIAFSPEKPYTALVIGHDVTERKRAAEELAKAKEDLEVRVAKRTAQLKEAYESIQDLNKNLEIRVKERTAELETANRELEAFSYSVSHDLKAPLRTMDGFSEAVLEDYAGKLDERGKDHLNEVRKASQEMSRLIDDLLKLARLIQAEMNPEKVDLSDLARSISEGLKRAQPERNVEFVIETEVFTKGDLSLLRIALNNLLENAWKYTTKVSEARIEFGSMQESGEKVFFVRDNGVGFNMEYAGKLFQPFQRLHSSKEYTGTGIGLATVQRIIRRHGGRIWAQSQEGQGTTFYFTLG